jgi:hypothetical protein
MTNSLRKLWEEKPLPLILFAALFFRLLSAIFSKGYGMSDDHFLVIEPAQAWVDGYNYNDCLPEAGKPSIVPSGHSFFYPGLHYLLFLFLKFIGFNDPQGKMYIVRFIHALFSMVIVYCGYKITERLAGKRQARYAGLLLALYWFMPMLSVRNLVEMVCIIPLMYATWLVIKNEERHQIKYIIAAGIMLGLAFSIRYQTMLFVFGLGLAVLLKGQFKNSFVLAFFFLLTAAILQGIPDYMIWGKPFVEFKEYVRYNQANAYGYLTGEWYKYLVLIGGILIPPISLFLLFGYFRNWRKHLILFLPSFFFLVFHSYFPNKQERFILPIVPFIIISGYIGWDDFISRSKFWIHRPKLNKSLWIFFWCINLIPLLVVSVAYSKRNRVEAMVYLAKKGDVNHIAIEDSNRDDILIPPRFYLQQWTETFPITNKNASTFYADTYSKTPPSERPNYIVFMQPDHLEERVQNLKKDIPTLTYETTIEPSFIDWLLNKMNPRNKNQTSYIYKIN